MSVNSPIRSIENLVSKSWAAVGQVPLLGPMMNLAAMPGMMLGKAVGGKQFDKVMNNATGAKKAPPVRLMANPASHRRGLQGFTVR